MCPPSPSRPSQGVPERGRDALSEWAKVVDCGDVPMSWLDKQAALKNLDQAHRRVSRKTPANPDRSHAPRVLMLGGDHTTTLSALRSTRRRWGKVSMIHFDTHLDTGNAGYGASLDYSNLDHGSFLHFAHEEDLTLNTSIHAGVHAALSEPKGDIENDVRCGFEFITNRDIDKLGVSSIIQRIRQRVGNSYVYVSIDIDVLDPAFAPGTGTPVSGGWSPRELLTILNGLNGLNVVGADVVEVAPVYDNKGETTTLAAAQIAVSLIELLVAKPAGPRP
ncbi:hypothetical protein CDD83_1311 [Cordyceps sp. RAO-2017]|nr:hypothetical protein CDD83_1311 [Cordyceps sp. RAO-2017]